MRPETAVCKIIQLLNITMAAKKKKKKRKRRSAGFRGKFVGALSRANKFRHPKGSGGRYRVSKFGTGAKMVDE